MWKGTWRPPSRPDPELPQRLGGIAVLRVQLQCFLVVGNSLRPVLGGEERFGEAAVRLARLRIGLDVQLEDADRQRVPVRVQELEAERIELALVEVPRR